MQYTFPDLIPNKVYYLQLTAGSTVFQKELKTRNYLEQYLGTRSIIVNQRTHTAGFIDTTFIGELVISQPNPTTIKLEEAETELSFEIDFQNIIDTTSIWFVSENPRVNVRFSLQEDDFIAKWYPTGLDTNPFWEYLKNE